LLRKQRKTLGVHFFAAPCMFAGCTLKYWLSRRS